MYDVTRADNEQTQDVTSAQVIYWVQHLLHLERSRNLANKQIHTSIQQLYNMCSLYTVHAWIITKIFIHPNEIIEIYN